MASFSSTSKARLATCHPDLQTLFEEVVRHFDCTIVQGHRSPAEQQRLYAQGRTEPGPVVTQIDGVTKLSSHNKSPSLAVDAVPYPIDWNDRERMTLFAGVVLGIAFRLGINVRWGGDWDRDTEVNDNSFDDLPHFELVP